MPLNLPVRHNEQLRKVLDKINADAELHQLWKCANINAVDRSAISDHGEVHIRIVTNAALRMLRLLVEAGISTGVEKNFGLTPAEAEVVVVLASCFHDVGIAIHRDNHETYSLFLAIPKLRELLSSLYEEPTRTIILSETLHAMIAHNSEQTCLTLEAGVVKVADALDMTQGRSRIPFQAGAVNIHAISAAAVDKVSIEKGDKRPIMIEVSMSNSAGIFQLDALLKRKLQHSSIAPYVQVRAQILGETEKRLLDVYNIGASND
jgi:metal-dependent HD superfamily phosphatase/phosphodiesterase